MTMKFYPPVFGYKPSFDCDKGDKHKMEVHYLIPNLYVPYVAY